jgi:hypothetical protein
MKNRREKKRWIQGRKDHQERSIQIKNTTDDLACLRLSLLHPRGAGMDLPRRSGWPRPLPTSARLVTRRTTIHACTDRVAGSRAHGHGWGWPQEDGPEVVETSPTARAVARERATPYLSIHGGGPERPRLVTRAARRAIQWTARRRRDPRPPTSSPALVAGLPQRASTQFGRKGMGNENYRTRFGL